MFPSLQNKKRSSRTIQDKITLQQRQYWRTVKPFLEESRESFLQKSKSQKLENLLRVWKIREVPDFYQLYFMYFASGVDKQSQNQLIQKEIDDTLSATSSFFKISNYQAERQSSIKDLKKQLEILSAFNCMNLNLPDPQGEKLLKEILANCRTLDDIKQNQTQQYQKFSQIIRQLRKITYNLISQIEKWKANLISMAGASDLFDKMNRVKIMYIHNDVNILYWVLNDTGFVGQSFLKKWANFVEKNDPFFVQILKEKPQNQIQTLILDGLRQVQNSEEVFKMVYKLTEELNIGIVLLPPAQNKKSSRRSSAQSLKNMNRGFSPQQKGNFINKGELNIYNTYNKIEIVYKLNDKTKKSPSKSVQVDKNQPKNRLVERVQIDSYTKKIKQYEQELKKVKQQRDNQRTQLMRMQQQKLKKIQQKEAEILMIKMYRQQQLKDGGKDSKGFIDYDDYRKNQRNKSQVIKDQKHATERAEIRQKIQSIYSSKNSDYMANYGSLQSNSSSIFEARGQQEKQEAANYLHNLTKKIKQTDKELKKLKQFQADEKLNFQSKHSQMIQNSSLLAMKSQFELEIKNLKKQRQKRQHELLVQKQALMREYDQKMQIERKIHQKQMNKLSRTLKKKQDDFLKKQKQRQEELFNLKRIQIQKQKQEIELLKERLQQEIKTQKLKEQLEKEIRDQLLQINDKKNEQLQVQEMRKLKEQALQRQILQLQRIQNEELIKLDEQNDQLRRVLINKKRRLLKTQVQDSSMMILDRYGRPQYLRLKTETLLNKGQIQAKNMSQLQPNRQVLSRTSKPYSKTATGSILSELNDKSDELHFKRTQGFPHKKPEDLRSDTQGIQGLINRYRQQTLKSRERIQSAKSQNRLASNEKNLQINNLSKQQIISGMVYNMQERAKLEKQLAQKGKRKNNNIITQPLTLKAITEPSDNEPQTIKQYILAHDRQVQERDKQLRKKKDFQKVHQDTIKLKQQVKEREAKSEPKVVIAKLSQQALRKQQQSMKKWIERTKQKDQKHQQPLKTQVSHTTEKKKTHAKKKHHSPYKKDIAIQKQQYQPIEVAEAGNQTQKKVQSNQQNSMPKGINNRFVTPKELPEEVGTEQQKAPEQLTPSQLEKMQSQKLIKNQQIVEDIIHQANFFVYQQVIEQKDLDEYFKEYQKKSSADTIVINTFEFDLALEMASASTSYHILVATDTKQVDKGIGLFRKEDNSYICDHLTTYQMNTLSGVALSLCQYIFRTDQGCDRIVFYFNFDNAHVEHAKIYQSFEELCMDHGEVYQMKADNLKRKYVVKRSLFTNQTGVGQVNLEKNEMAMKFNVKLFVGKEDPVEKIEYMQGKKITDTSPYQISVQLLLTEQIRAKLTKNEFQELKQKTKNNLRLKQLLLTAVMLEKKGVSVQEFKKISYDTTEIIKQQSSHLPKHLQQANPPIFCSQFKENFPVTVPVKMCRLMFGQQPISYICLRTNTPTIVAQSTNYTSKGYFIALSNKHKMLIVDSQQFSGLTKTNPEIDLFFYFKHYVKNIKDFTKQSYPNVYLPRINYSTVYTHTQMGLVIQKSLYSTDEVQFGDCRLASSIKIQPTHKDLVVKPPFLLCILSGRLQRASTGTPLYARLITVKDLI